MKIKLFITLALCLIVSGLQSQNLLSNGDFETGTNGVGFNVNGNGYIQLNPPYTGVTTSGNYAFSTNPQLVNFVDFAPSVDHTTGTGNMMIIDGNAVGGNQRFWSAGNTGGGVCGLIVGQTYTFSYWIKSIATSGTLPIIGIQFNNTSSNSLYSGSVTPTATWQKVTYTFVPNNACVNIELWNTNTDFIGNDFAVDDFEVRRLVPLSITSSKVNLSCTTTTDGSIQGYALGGNNPYTYTLTGTVNPPSNSTGYFGNLPAGTYTISVSDSSLPVANASQTGIVISPPTNPLTVTPNSTACLNAPFQLSASGSTTGYSWTAVPLDSTLTTPNIANPIVSPAVNTTYTVSSTVTTIEDLITNGSFTNGNIGFSSDYQYLANSVVPGIQGAYGVVTNPNTWFVGFTNCPDHTTGTGNMFVADGSILNSGNDKVWCQTVPVPAGQTFSFSYWIQAIAAGNPANIEVEINGVVIGSDLAPSTVCGWVQRTYTWNSGASTTAQICIYDRNFLLNGNDFALDDITFTYSKTCTFTKDVIVTVTTPTASFPAPGSVTVCPNVPAIATVNGTPNAIVNMIFSGGAITAFLNAAGTATFTIPGVSNSETITIASVSIFATGCTNSNVTSVLNVIVVPNGCATVLADSDPTDTNINYVDPNICGLGDCRTLTASFSDVADTTTYAVSAIPYCPQAPFENNPGWNVILASGTLGDDDWADDFSFPAGMQFCFFGTNYNKINVGTNGVIRFPFVHLGPVPPATNPDGTYNAGDFCEWQYTQTIPNTGFPIKNSIFGVYQDTNFSVTPPPPLQININYNVVGTYPCRKFIANYTNIPQFQCGNSIGLSTTQIVLYEVSNIIEVYVERRTACTGWNGGRGTIGIINGVGNTAFAAPGRNAAPFSTDPTPTNLNNGDNVSEAWRFTPTGPNVTTTFQWLENGVPYSTNPVINVCPTADVTYTAETTYTVCGVQQTASKDIDLFFFADLTVQPQDLTQCGNIFDLTENTDNVLGTLNPNDYDISFYTSMTNAEDSLNPILDPENFPSTGQTIYMNINDGASGCVYIKEFDLVLVSSVATTITCGTTSSTSIQFNWNGLTDATGYIVSYQINTGPIVTIGSIGNLTSYTINGLSQGNTVTLTVLPTGASTTCFVNTTFTCSTSPCGTITNPVGAQTVCLGGDPTTISINTSETAFNSISFYYFTAQQTGNSMYSGGNFLMNASPVMNVGSYNMPPLGTMGSLPNAVGTYYVYAILNPIPTDVACRPFQEIIIVVLNPVTPTFTQVTPICNGGSLSALPTTSNNGITGVWTPALDNTNTTIYTFTPNNASQCGTTTTMTITVNPLVTPTFTQVAPICNGGSLSALPTTSNNGITGVWTPALNNTGTTTYTFTPNNASQCGTTTTMTITVNPIVTPTFTQVAPICFGAILNPLPTTSNNGITGVWSPILDNTNTTTYTFTPNNPSQCGTTTTMTIVVNPLPISTQPSPMTQCSNGATNQATFNLSSNNATVSGGNPAYAVTYHISQGDANSGSNDVDAVNYLGTDGQTVYIRLENTATGCFSTTTVLLNVTQGPTANIPPPYHQCDPNNDGTVDTFDLQTLTAFITGGASNINVSYHETFDDAQILSQPITGLYQNINDYAQTIYANVSFANTTGCPNIIPIQLVVDYTPIFPVAGITDFELCDYVTTLDNEEPFYLHEKDIEIINGQPNTAVEYYLTQADAIAQSPALPIPYLNISNPQQIWVNIYDTVTGCNRVSSMNLVVNAVPLATLPGYTPYTKCDYTSQDGYEVFNLLSKESGVLLGQLGMSVTWYPTRDDAVADTNAIPQSQIAAYQNVDPNVQTLGIRITNTTTGCYIVSSMDIRVEEVPTPVQPTMAFTICDEEQNGISEFDLESLTDAIKIGQLSYVVTYHETQTDAENGINVIDTTVPYENVDSFVQFIWVSVVDGNNSCRTVFMIELNVNPSPSTPLPQVLDDIVECDDDANDQDGEKIINLTPKSQEILAFQPLAPSNYQVTYYTSEADANVPINQIIDTVNYSTTNGKNIWVRVENMATDCYDLVSFNIVINTPIELKFPAPTLRVCDTDANPNDSHTEFDLTLNNGNLPLNPATGYTVNYYTAYPVTPSSILITTPNAYTNQSAGAVQALGVEVIDANGCKSYTSMDIRVLPVPTPNTNPKMLTPKCESAIGSGQNSFDVTENAIYIQNNTTDVTLHYYPTLADAQAVPPTNEILTPTNVVIGNPALVSQSPRPVNELQYVYVVVQNNVNQAGVNVDYNNQTCRVIVAQPFIINPLPSVNTIPAQQICEEDAAGNDGFEVFNLTDYEIGSDTVLLDGTIDNIANFTAPLSTYVFNYYLDLAHTMPIANPASFTNTVINGQTIYYSVSSTHTYTYTQPGTSNSMTYTTSCESFGEFDIVVNPKPNIAPPTNPLNTCDDPGVDNDGYQVYDLTSMDADILNGQLATDFTVTYYESEYNPDANPPLLPTPITFTTNYLAYTHTIWAAVTNNVTGCFKTQMINLVVEQLPEPFITNAVDLNTICVDFTTKEVVRPLTLEVENQTQYLNDPTTPAPTYTYQWFEDGVAIPAPEGTAGPSYTIDKPLNDTISSVFTVVMTTQNPDLTCNAISQDFTVIQSGQASIPVGTQGYTVTNAFSDNQIITISIEGYGLYQYSLDDGPRQDSPIFEFVSLGAHTIYVWDIEGGIGNSCDVLTINQVQTIDYPLYFTPNGDGIHDTWNIQGLEGQPTAKIFIFDRFGKLIKQISPSGNGWDGLYNAQQLPSTDYWFTVDYTEQDAQKQFKAHFSLKR